MDIPSPSKLYHDNIPTNVRMFLRGIFGEQTPVDESYMQPQDLETIRLAIGEREKQNVSEGRMQEQVNAELAKDPWAHSSFVANPWKTDPGTLPVDNSEEFLRTNLIEIPTFPTQYKPSHSITYHDYPVIARDEGVGVNPTPEKERASERLRTMLGQFNYEKDPNGDVIATDHYDFNPIWGSKEHPRQPSLGDVASSAVDAVKSRSAYPLARAVGGALVPDDGKHGYPIRINLGNPATWNK